jgi:hypothetical protein
MRKLTIALLAVTIVSANAQQPPQPLLEGSNWQHLQALPAGASIQVSARTRHANCTFEKADDDTLTCTHGKSILFQRSEVKSIKIPRRGRSTLIALGIGAGSGAIVGAAITGCSTAQKDSFFGCFITPTRPQGAAIGAALFGVIATPIGFFTDFARSTIYKAP